MTRIILHIAFAFCSTSFAAGNLKKLEITYDNYYAKIKIRNHKIKFEDPYHKQAITLKSCNRSAWNKLVANLSTETKDYELLVNTQKIPNSTDDVILKQNDSKLRVTRTTSLGGWSRNINAHWNDLVTESKRKCNR